MWNFDQVELVIVTASIYLNAIIHALNCSDESIGDDFDDVVSHVDGE